MIYDIIREAYRNQCKVLLDASDGKGTTQFVSISFREDILIQAKKENDPRFETGLRDIITYGGVPYSIYPNIDNAPPFKLEVMLR